jgi:hypothetical protein
MSPASARCGILTGDARNLSDFAVGGNDALTGGNGAINEIYGDAWGMSNNAASEAATTY